MFFADMITGMTFSEAVLQINYRLILPILLFAVPLQFTEARSEDGQPIPRSYHGISLGMSLEEVKTLLLQDPWFNYRGDEDVSLLERPRASLIDAGGSLFIKRGLFQFEDDALSAILLELNPETIDWFTVYTTLEDRYGNPVDMNPQKAWWEDGSTRLALERPLTVKYLDLSVFEAAIAENKDRAAWRAKAREEFLDEF
jgi:hypothetical protein